MTSPILEVQKLSFRHDDSELIVSDVNFILNEGETLGIIGPNGGGKSTLLKLIAKKLTPTEGKILYRGETILPHNFISYVPQATQLNLTIPITVKESFSLELIKPNNDWENEIYRLIGIQDKTQKFFHELSGGERQRALIGRALLKKPRLLLLDEPTKGLDMQGVDQLFSLIKKLKKEFNTSVIIIDHHLHQILPAAQKILCINKKTHWHEPKEELTHHVLKNIYHCEFEHLVIHATDSLEVEENHDHTHEHKHL